MKLIPICCGLGVMAAAAFVARIGPVSAESPVKLLPPVVQTALADVAESAPPMIELTKTCPPLRYLGRDAAFEINVSNRGGSAAQNVVVNDVITGGFTFVSADNGGTRQGDRVVWNIGTLDVGQTRKLTVNLRCDRIGQVRNTATVSYCAQAVAACQMDVRGIPAVLLECVDDPDPIEVGQSLTYTIIVTNQGSMDDTNIVITATLPPEQEFVKAAGATNATANGNVITFAPLPVLKPRTKATFLVTAKGIKAADSRFKVSLDTDIIDTPVEETESTHIY